MADKNMQHSNSNSNSSDVQDLLAILDRMQNRPRVQEVEDVLIQQGRPDLVRMDVYTAPKAEDGFVPTVQSESLSDLLITPGEEPFLQMNQAQQKNGTAKSDEPLFYGDEVMEEDWEQLPPPPEKKLNPIKTLLRGAGMMLPRKGDSPFRVLGKGSFWMGLLASVLVAIMLVSDMKIEPMVHAQLCEELYAAYNSTTDVTTNDTAEYPKGMLASFKQLYQRNSDVQGWISFHAKGRDFLNIEAPFVQGENDTYYKTHDYDKNKSDYGTMYLDSDQSINGYHDADQVLVIHSNSTPDQTMLSSLNRLVGPVNYARSAPELTLSTLYRRDIYYVFALAMTDGSGMDEFDPFQVDFENEDQFLEYIQSLHARSLFSYPVDVIYDDSIVLLSVPTGDVSTGMDDGRLVVAARRRRPGEMSVQVNKILKKNAIMPYSWYTSRGSTPHSYFYTGEEIPSESTTTTTGSIPATSMENPHGTTTTTEDRTNNSGGTVINKDPNVTGGLSTTQTNADGTEETDPTGSDPTGDTPDEESSEDEENEDDTIKYTDDSEMP